MEVKFLHIADIHIGIENYGRLDTATGLHTRLQDFVRCVRFAFEEALRQKVDLVIFSGDAYRSCDPTPTHQREFASLVRLLSQEDVPIVMVTGNHDSPVAFGKASSIDIFQTLGPDEIQVVSEDKLLSVETKSGIIQVACLPWLHRSRLVTKAPFDNLTQSEVVEKLQDLGAQLIDGLASQVDSRYPAVLAAHISAADAALSGSEQTAIIGRDPVFLTSTLANSAFDYVALGHIHKFQDLNPSGFPPVVYSGSVERIDFGEENEARGAVLVTIRDHDEQDATGPSRHVEYTFLGTPARPFKSFHIEVEEDQDPTQAIIDRTAGHDLSETVVRIVYDIQGEREDTLDLKAIKRALSSAFLVASIIRKPRTNVHARRADISEDMGLKEALHAYVLNRPELETIEEEIQLAAASLEAELEEGRNP
jgi:exonuclease SbcD